MIDVKIFNNLSRKKETLSLQAPGVVKFYSCGPTTYDFLHVGNARALVVGDLINRSLRALGYNVTFVRNYTDVDDKIINRAKEFNTDPIQYAAKFVIECEFDITNLNMLPPDFAPKVSESMEEIIQMISDIISQGKAYIKEGEVLFDTTKAQDYGKLSKKDLTNLSHGKRVKVASNKDHANDFVLWKPAKAGEVSWESPWGNGRPGWHIECSAMAKKFLGAQIDLHHGGVDLMFPHHENEIAQSEAANGCAFCNNWVHNEFLNFGKEKMAKSLGNVVRIRDFNNQYSGQVLRHLLLSVHYRSHLDWSPEIIKRAVDEVKKIHTSLLEMSQLTPKGSHELKDYISLIKEELANDFNSATALSLIFSFIKEVNENQEHLSENSVAVIKKTFNFLQKDLGFLSQHPEQTLVIISKLDTDLSQSEISESEILTLIETRTLAKQTKDWRKADEVRNHLKNLKIVLKDESDGSTTWSKLRD